METLENRLQKRVHLSLYAILFLTTLLALSVLLEGCAGQYLDSPKPEKLASGMVALNNGFAFNKEINSSLLGS